MSALSISPQHQPSTVRSFERRVAYRRLQQAEHVVERGERARVELAALKLLKVRHALDVERLVPRGACGVEDVLEAVGAEEVCLD